MQPIKSLGYLTESPAEDCKSLAQEPTDFFLRGQTVNILGLCHTDPVTTPQCYCYRPKAAMNNIQRNGCGYSPIKLYLQKWEAGSQFIVFDPCPRGWQSHKMEGIWVPEWLPGEHYLPPMKALTLIQQYRNLRRHYTEFSGRGKPSLTFIAFTICYFM